MAVDQWVIPMRLQTRSRTIRTNEGPVEVLDTIIDDVGTIYAALMMVPLNVEEWRPNARTINRLIRRLEPRKFDVDSDYEETDGIEVIDTLELNADEFTILNKVFNSEIPDFVVRGFLGRTSIYIQDEYENFKKACPQAFEGAGKKP